MISRLAFPCAVILIYLTICGPTHAESCRSESFKGASYIVCSFNPTKDDLRIYWRDDNGKPYRTFAALAAGSAAAGVASKVSSAIVQARRIVPVTCLPSVPQRF